MKRVSNKGKQCSHSGCERPAFCKGLCRSHHRHQSKRADMQTPTKVRMRNKGMLCSHGDCKRPARHRRLCTLHYERHCFGRDMDAPIKERKRNKGMRCSHGECERPAQSGGLCTLHHYRQCNGKDMDAPTTMRNKGKRCIADGCNEPAAIKRLCKFHYGRKRRGIPFTDPIIKGFNGTVYLLTSPIGRKYVGQTKGSIESRMDDYRQNKGRNQPKVAKAIAQHGIDSFTIVVIMTGITSQSALNRCERAFIEMLDTINNGLNVARGGGVGINRPKTCAVPGCDGKHKGLGYCMKHHSCYRRYGDPLIIERQQAIRKSQYRQIDEMLAEGKSAAAIAEYLDVSLSFVVNRVQQYERKRWKNTCIAKGCLRPRDNRKTKYCSQHAHVGKRRCRADNCTEIAIAKGWCKRHYTDVRVGNNPHTTKHKPIGVCENDGCDGPRVARGLCSRHYQQWRYAA